MADLAKTSVPGIYRRHVRDCARGQRCECPYALVSGNRWTTHATLDEAREAKRTAARQAKLERAHGKGLHHDAPQDGCPICASGVEALRAQADAAPKLHEYALAWVERYHGTGKRGFRDETRAEYRGLLNAYALRYFGAEVRLRDIGPKQVSEFIAWLVRQPNGRGGTLSDKTVRNALGPLRACLASAKREGDIAENPVVGAALPHRPRISDDEELPRPFPPILLDGERVESMELVVSLIHPDHRVMFELLAATGLRRSELLALTVGNLALDGERPLVKVRQRTRAQAGRGQVIGALKSPHSRRDLPISLELADRLRALTVGRASDALVFESPYGGPYDPAHLYNRVLRPACSEAGVAWAAFHTFRHTVASRMFASGRTAVQVQHWLGHHSAAFTLRTYVHLLDADDLGGPLEPARTKEKLRDCPEIAANLSAASFQLNGD